LSFRRRLNRLERELANRGRCRACSSRPDSFVNVFRQESLDAIPIPRKVNADAGHLCTACGWAPDVTEIFEILVHSHQDARWLRERGVFEQDTSGEAPESQRRSARNRLA
jgi:hypothetical protein